ncbi:MAG: flagellar basal body P-ring formation protein FlgA [Deltaproteobacteria bacterium]|nr:flagellar basal body P-ring formation protein FlgA [Deltaproteobacteria bacterium]
MKRLLVIGYWSLVIGIIGCIGSLHGLADASSLQASASSYEVPDEEIKAAVAEYLDKMLPLKKDGMTIEDIEVKTKVMLPKKELTPVVVLPKGNKIPGKINLMVNYQDKDWTKTVWVSARVVQSKEVIIANRALPIKHIIEIRDVRLEKVNVNDITGSAFSDINMLLGMGVKRPVAANSIIKEDYVYKPAVIKKGETVDVVVESGAIIVTVKCEAREDGFLGRGIKVGNLSSGKDITGVVVGAGKVLVRL